MMITGLTENQISAITNGLDLNLDNVRQIGRTRVAFKVNARSSRSRFARRTQSGRRSKSVCDHGMTTLVNRCFDAGATRIQSMWGVWHDMEEFSDMLDSDRNIGSDYNPFEIFDDRLCECVECPHCGDIYEGSFTDHTCRTPILTANTALRARLEAS